MYFLIFLLILIAAILAYLIMIYNNFVIQKNYIREAFSTMDVYLKKRWDLVPNLVEITKGYAQHEKETLENLTNARNTNYSSLSKEDKIDVNSKLSMGLSKLIAVVENYPDLKANQNFLELQKELSKIEQDIANSRKYYNGTVREYNTSIETFPSLIIARIFKFQIEKLFEIEDFEKDNVKVSI